MKVVWLVNTILPQIADKQGKKKGVINGWTVLLADMLADDPGIDLTVFYPQKESLTSIIGDTGKLHYVGFYEEAIPELIYNPEMTGRMEAELDRIKPDVVHIWGSEYVHTLSMVRAFNCPEKTVISIQGLIHKIGAVYDAGLPEKVIKRHTFRDFIRNDSIGQQKEKFLKRGKCEIEALKQVSHVIGRTGWDRKAALEVNPDLQYHFAGEILREEFYRTEKKWSPDKAKQHRIFMTQSYYPVKGMHFVLKALSIVVKEYPDTVLSVTGKDMRPGSLKDIIKQDSYGKYICDLIKEKGLDNNIEFLGEQEAKDMIDRYLQCSAFLLPSVIENSSNSLGEAMMLGVPCIAAATGGTPDMIKADEGWLYDFCNAEELSSALYEVFNITDRERNGERTELGRILDRAFVHASESYDNRKNTSSYIRIYDEIMKKEY